MSRRSKRLHCFKKTQKKVLAVLVKFNLQLLGIQINRFFIHLKVAHKSISYTISYTSWMPKLGKEVAKITFSPFLVSVLQHIVEPVDCFGGEMDLVCMQTQVGGGGVVMQRCKNS